jgi:hypothetical protein
MELTQLRGMARQRVNLFWKKALFLVNQKISGALWVLPQNDYIRNSSFVAPSILPCKNSKIIQNRS